MWRLAALGSKNRIYLGVLSSIILHHIRNKYAKHIFMSKRVQTKIKLKHPDVVVYTQKDGFLLLLENTIATLPYKDSLYADNFIACVDEKYILYALKQEKHHTSCSTIFKLKPSALKRYYEDERFTILRRSAQEEMKNYMNQVR